MFKIQELFPRRSLAALIIPLIIEQILACTMGMADTIMVASLSEAAVSGVSLVDTINVLLIQVFGSFATGGAVIMSQYLGRGEEKNAENAARQLIVVNFLISLAIALPALAFNRALLRLIFGKISDDVMASGVTFFYLSALSYPFLALFNACAAIFRSMNNSRLPMAVSVLMNILNVAGNAYFIFGLKMGVAGSGAATLISRMIGAAVMIAFIRRRGNEIRVAGLRGFRFNFVIINNILKIGVPNGLEGGIFQIGKILVQTLISSFGTAAIAANAIGNTVSGFSCIPGNAVGLAMITVVGRCVGAGEYGQAVKYTKKLMTVTYILMAASSGVCLIFAEQIVGAFHLSREASADAVFILNFYFIFCALIWPIAFTLPNALRAAGDARFTMFVSIASMWISRIGFSYLLADYFKMALAGVWIAMIIDWGVRSIFFLWRFFSGRWKKIRVI